MTKTAKTAKTSKAKPGPKPGPKPKPPLSTKDIPRPTAPGPRPGLAPRTITKGQAAKNEAPRRKLSPLVFAAEKNIDVFLTVQSMQDAGNRYRVLCDNSGDIPTIKGFCLSCGKSSRLLKTYIEHKDPEFSEAAQIIKDWIYEQKEHATSLGFYPLNLMIWTCVNEHNCVNTRTYTETDNKTKVEGAVTLSSIIDKADTGGLPAPPGIVKRLPGSKAGDEVGSKTAKKQGNRKDIVQVFEMAPVIDTKGQSRPGSKAAARKGKTKS
jgi:hypothetical protein